LTEREEFLVQSQERSGGIVVYTGMNNNGDSFIGNRKTSSSTGEEVTFDNPIPTITGEDPSRLSAVFDEVTVKERLVVEGGNSGTILSQFDGPVTFNKEVKFTDAVNVRSQLKVSNQQDSTTSANGALIVSGGVGIAKTLNVGGNVTVSGTITGNVIGNVTGNVVGNVTGNVTGTATNATNINISSTASSDTTTSIVLVANQSTGNQSPFIDSGLSYNADTNALMASTFSGALSGNASSATQLQTSKTFTITGVVDAPAVSFDGTDNVNLVTTLDDNSITTNKIVNNSVTTAKINFQSSLVPTGSVFYMAASSADTATGGSVTISAVTYHAPEGYLICNGGDIPTSGTFQGVSASLLQNLRNFLGGTYGATGRLPDLRNNFAGYSAVPGTIGGDATVTLDITQIPLHSHGGITENQSANHRHVMPGDDALSSGAGGAGWEGTNVGGFNYDARSDQGNGKYWLTGYNRENHAHNISPEGGGQSHANLPPYIGMLPVIKY
jgi:microcystin-dependent protein/cytoskeletal protein CcmA (bactofilin family)